MLNSMKYFQLLVKTGIFIIILVLVLLVIDLFNTYQQVQKKRDFPDGINENVSYDYPLISLEESLNESEYIILDVREPEEYFARHLEGALNVRLGDLHRNEKTLDYLKDIAGNKTFATYCYENRYTRQGDGRSGRAARFLLDNNLSAAVIEGGMREFVFYRNIINENYFYSLGKFVFYSYQAQKIEDSDASCVVRFAKEETLVETENESHNLAVNSGFMSTHEWGEMMNIIGQNLCVAECVDRSTCFYARLFGMRLDLQGGEFEGFVVDDGDE